MQILGALLVCAGVVHLVCVTRFALFHRGERRRPVGTGVVCGLWSLALAPLVASRVIAFPTGLALAAFVTAGLAAYAWRRTELWAVGAMVWASWIAFTAVGVVWGTWFMATLPLSLTTRALLWTAAVFVAVGLPASVITQRESIEVLVRRRWRRQHPPLASLPEGPLPFVSIQVPCHAEPPELVIATLDRLAQLDYPHFEVLVIDNNTADERLWRPVEAHCARLGNRFRFLHVMGITGAKAGALNWAAQYTNPNAELVGIVDADYQVDPSWLRATVGYFTDPGVGFVQPPHAYRDWHDRRFGRMANWEYTMFFATTMVALQEHGAGITVGTMSVIRRRALDEAGGWAEWCLTEDSELAIRLHALGYRSVYLTEPLGWGLIPETFAAYRKQRARWTAGPVQEFRGHWRKYLHPKFGGSPTYDRRQRIHHANHGLDVALVGIRALAWPFALATALSIVVHHEHVPVPFPLWIATLVAITSALAIRWMQFCKITGAPIRGAIGAAVAYQALTHIITVSSLRAIFGRPPEWHRTNKFRPSSDRALAAARTETIIALVFLATALATYALGYGGITTMLAIGFAIQGITYLCAPLLAWITAQDLKQADDDKGEASFTNERVAA